MARLSIPGRPLTGRWAGTACSKYVWYKPANHPSLCQRRRASSTDFHGVVRPVAIWLAQPGKVTDVDSIIDQLPIPSGDDHSYLTTAIFLVTPKLAHLFEPGANFHTRAVNRIWSHAGFREQKPTLESVVAIVDALPVLIDNSGPRLDGRDGSRGGEGIALCLTPPPRTTPDLGGMRSPPPLISFSGVSHRLSDSESMRSSADVEQRETISYSAPVANTLFVNGRTHTMFKESWVRIGPEISSNGVVQYLAHLDLWLYDLQRAPERHPARFYSTLKTLTEPATIVSSMGNILRQVNLNGEIISSSQKLEEIVPPYVAMKHTLTPTSEIKVFALIYPESTSPLEVYTRANGFPRFKIHQNEEIQRLLADEGGRLFRVTSGGAGWGKKAGLLSLEPVTQLNQEPEELSAASFFPGFELDPGLDDRPETAKLLPEGHRIQFLACWNEPVTEKSAITASDLPIPYWLKESYFSNQQGQKFWVGTTFMNDVGDDSSANVNSDCERPAFAFCPGRFGFLTTTAMSLSVKKASALVTTPFYHVQEETKKKNCDVIAGPDEEVTHSTLIEVPNSSFGGMYVASHGKYAAEQGNLLYNPPGTLEFETYHPMSRIRTVRVMNSLEIRRLFDDDPRMASISVETREAAILAIKNRERKAQDWTSNAAKPLDRIDVKRVIFADSPAAAEDRAIQRLLSDLSKLFPEEDEDEDEDEER